MLGPFRGAKKNVENVTENKKVSKVLGKPSKISVVINPLTAPSFLENIFASSAILELKKRIFIEWGIAFVTQVLMFKDVVLTRFVP